VGEQIANTATVLVVEDDELSRRYATLALAQLGYEVIAIATRSARSAAISVGRRSSLGSLG
jgi:CheY-like chemotaxis protein